LLAYLEPEKTTPSITHQVWEGAEPRLRAVIEGLQQRANEGHPLPRSMGLVASGKAARAGARQFKSPAYPHQESVISQERSEALGEQQEPPRRKAGEVSEWTKPVPVGRIDIHNDNIISTWLDRHDFLEELYGRRTGSTATTLASLAGKGD
jgi:hypothetical protein